MAGSSPETIWVPQCVDCTWNTFLLAPFQLRPNGSVTDEGVTALANNRPGNGSSVANVEQCARQCLLLIVNAYDVRRVEENAGRLQCNVMTDARTEQQGADQKAERHAKIVTAAIRKRAGRQFPLSLGCQTVFLRGSARLVSILRPRGQHGAIGSVSSRMASLPGPRDSR